jgi:hypothetical protein
MLYTPHPWPLFHRSQTFPDPEGDIPRLDFLPLFLTPPIGSFSR